MALDNEFKDLNLDTIRLRLLQGRADELENILVGKDLSAPAKFIENHAC